MCHSDEDSWLVEYRYNGRLSGANQSITKIVKSGCPYKAVEMIEREAVRAEGAVYITGFSVIHVKENCDGSQD